MVSHWGNEKNEHADGTKTHEKININDKLNKGTIKCVNLRQTITNYTYIFLLHLTQQNPLQNPIKQEVLQKKIHLDSTIFFSI